MVLKQVVLFTTLLLGVTIVYIATKKPSENQKWLLLTLMCGLFCAINYSTEIMCVEPIAMSSLYTTGLMIKPLVLVCFFEFLSHYCNIHFNRAVNFTFAAFMFGMMIVLATNRFHQLVYTNAEVRTDFYVPYLVFEPQIFYHVLIYGMVILTVVIDAIICKRAKSARGVERKRLLLLAITELAPILGYALQVTVMQGMVDLITVGFAVSGALLLILVHKYGLLDMVQIAQEQIIENTKDGLIVVDTDFNVLFANPAVKHYYPGILNLQTEEERKGLEELFAQEESVCETQGMYCEIRTSKLYEGKVLRGYMAWIFDMTFINQYTNEILVVKDEAEKASLAKTQFLTTMSHEIRTPMNAILGFTELILQEKNMEKVQEYAFDIKRSGQNLLHTINSVLDVSKIEAGKVEMADETYYTQSMLEDVSILVAGMASDKGLIYQTEIDKTLPYQMRGSVGHIREILMNILSNAVKYTKEGSVTFCVNCIEKTDNTIKLAYIVKDTGIGMRSEDLEKLYEKFEQFDRKANRNVEGTGLGMSIVKGLVEQMGGEIQVESEYGVGTKITVLLTQQIADDRPIGEIWLKMREGERRFVQSFRTSAKILVVDDNETNLKVVDGFLKKFGVYADCVTSGMDAIHMVEKNTYDLIFMDHMMPDMDGIETMQYIKDMQGGKYRDIPVVALTANAISGVREQMLALGFSGYLAKPISMEMLEREMRHVLPESLITKLSPEEIVGYSQEQTDYLKGILKNLDVERGIQNCGGSLQDYLQVLDVVARHGEKRVKKLETLINEEDFENYTIDVHALKSTAANIGAMELSKLAYNQEMAGKAKDYDAVRKNSRSLLYLYVTVLSEIDKLKREGLLPGESAFDTQTEVNGQKDAEGERLSVEELLQLLENVEHFVAEFEFEKAEEMLKEIMLTPMNMPLLQKLDEIRQDLHDLDIETARGRLKETKDNLIDSTNHG